MAKIINLTAREISLPTRHVIPRGAALETTNAVIDCSDNWPMINGLALSGALQIERDPDPAEDAPAAVAAPAAANPAPTTSTGGDAAPEAETPAKASKPKA